MKWLITGAAGMVGTDLQNALAIRGEDFLPLKRSDLDITDSRAVMAAELSHNASQAVIQARQDGFGNRGRHPAIMPRRWHPQRPDRRRSP